MLTIVKQIEDLPMSLNPHKSYRITLPSENRFLAEAHREKACQMLIEMQNVATSPKNLTTANQKISTQKTSRSGKTIKIQIYSSDCSFVANRQKNKKEYLP